MDTIKTISSHDFNWYETNGRATYDEHGQPMVQLKGTVHYTSVRVEGRTFPYLNQGDYDPAKEFKKSAELLRETLKRKDIPGPVSNGVGFYAAKNSSLSPSE